MSATYARRRALGDFGEQLAADYLRDRGLQILDRNWRCKAGELDIVAADGAAVVGCEVKTRTSDRFGTPLEAITPDKAGRLHRLVQLWAVHHDFRYQRLRVDLVAVVVPEHQTPTIEHVVGVV
jgi:putative endonuclease